MSNVVFGIKPVGYWIDIRTRTYDHKGGTYEIPERVEFKQFIWKLDKTPMDHEFFDWCRKIGEWMKLNHEDKMVYRVYDHGDNFKEDAGEWTSDQYFWFRDFEFLFREFNIKSPENTFDKKRYANIWTDINELVRATLRIGDRIKEWEAENEIRLTNTEVNERIGYELAEPWERWWFDFNKTKYKKRWWESSPDELVEQKKAEASFLMGARKEEPRKKWWWRDK